MESILLVKTIESIRDELSGISIVVVDSKRTRDTLLRLLDNSHFLRGRAKAFEVKRKDVPFEFCNFMRGSGVNSFSFKKYVLSEISKVSVHLRFEMNPVFLEDMKPEEYINHREFQKNSNLGTFPHYQEEVSEFDHPVSGQVPSRLPYSSDPLLRRQSSSILHEKKKIDAHEDNFNHEEEDDMTLRQRHSYPHRGFKFMKRESYDQIPNGHFYSPSYPNPIRRGGFRPQEYISRQSKFSHH